jgi:hypothetical protein
MAKEAAKVEGAEGTEQIKSVELNEVQKEALAYLFKEKPTAQLFYTIESGECFDNLNLVRNAVGSDTNFKTITREMFNGLIA